MRLTWLVTPLGRMASISGCTTVLVAGTITAILARVAKASRLVCAVCVIEGLLHFQIGCLRRLRPCGNIGTQSIRKFF